MTRPGQVRIIGGMWRGRKLAVPSLAELRPTGDRIRETLFNWLSPIIGGSYCLDAFAGSGALGFEALSRGAAHATLIDQSAVVVNLLKQEAEILKTTTADIYQATLPNQLKRPAHLFDIVFLDPPFQSDLLLPMCFYLEENNLLAKEARIYVETNTPVNASTLPNNWEVIKAKKTGGVAYCLLSRIERQYA